MGKNVLIIGGTGFIGYHIANLCLKRKWNVSSISLNKPKKIRKLKRVKYLIIDISNKKELLKLDKYKFEYVINLGGYVNHTSKLQIKKYHYLGVKNLFNYFQKKNLEKFIQVGSSSEYGLVRSPQKENNKCDPRGFYGQYKLEATKFLLKKFKQDSFPVTILRFYQVYGPKQNDDRFIPQIIKGCLKKKTFPTSNGKQERDFLYIDDAVRAIDLCLRCKKCIGKIINIGSGKPIKLLKIFSYIVKKIGSGKPLIGKIKLRPDEQLIVYPNLSNAVKFLNWKKRINFKQGINKTINEYKKI